MRTGAGARFSQAGAVLGLEAAAAPDRVPSGCTLTVTDRGAATVSVMEKEYGEGEKLPANVRMTDEGNGTLLKVRRPASDHGVTYRLEANRDIHLEVEGPGLSEASMCSTGRGDACRTEGRGGAQRTGTGRGNALGEGPEHMRLEARNGECWQREDASDRWRKPETPEQAEKREHRTHHRRHLMHAAAEVIVVTGMLASSPGMLPGQDVYAAQEDRKPTAVQVVETEPDPPGGGNRNSEPGGANRHSDPGGPGGTAGEDHWDVVATAGAAGAAAAA